MGNNTKKAPYRHQDGSNCWTKNCKLSHVKNSTPSFVFPERPEPPKSRIYSSLEYGSSGYNSFIAGTKSLAEKASADEVKAVFEYSGWLYKEYYSYLEGKNADGSEYGSQYEDNFREAITRAMANNCTKMDSLISKAGVLPKPVTVFRGERFPEGVDPARFLAEKFPKGGRVHMKRYLSTSLEPKVATDITGDAPSYVMVIEARKGAMLGDELSEQGLREREMLLPRNTEYEVVSVESSVFRFGPNKKKEITVHLRQL